jgi:hypothetical protein
VSDLLALAIIRRMLLQLGHASDADDPAVHTGSVERWMRQPLAQLEGKSPLQALQQADGHERVFQCLSDLVAR